MGIMGLEPESSQIHIWPLPFTKMADKGDLLDSLCFSFPFQKVEL
jgi:hypothetical protein